MASVFDQAYHTYCERSKPSRLRASSLFRFRNKWTHPRLLARIAFPSEKQRLLREYKRNAPLGRLHRFANGTLGMKRPAA
jgi:hypothetical protein